jgi:ComF family protein
MHLVGGLRTLLRDVTDFCYPGRCETCDADCAGGEPLCSQCAAQLRGLEVAPACGRCAKPLVNPEDPCPYCLGKGLRPYDRILRLGVFRDPIRQMVHRMKYHRRWTLAEYLADRLREQAHVRRVLEGADCLVPVPLHRLRQMSRGYNQADVLAAALANALKPHPRIVRPVVRLRNTETQTHLHSRAQREANLRDAFALVRPQVVHGRHVVVIDDVMTTGATLRAFARALRPGRPASLSAIVVAIADPKGSDFQKV